LFTRGEDLNDFGEDLVAVVSMHGEGELRGEEAVLDSDIETLTFMNHGQVLFTLGENGECGGEAGARLGLVRKKRGQDVEDGGSQNVHSIKTEVLAASESGNDEALFGFSWSGFLEDGVDTIEAGFACKGLAADSAEVGKEIFARDLNGGDGTACGTGGIDETLGSTAGFCCYIDVIADEMKEGLVTHEVAGAEDRVRIAAGIMLGNEGEADGIFGDKLGVGLFIPGPDDDADLVNAGAEASRTTRLRTERSTPC